MLGIQKKYFLTEGTFNFTFYFHLPSHELGISFTSLCFVFLFFIFHQLQKLKFQTTLLLCFPQIKSNQILIKPS